MGKIGFYVLIKVKIKIAVNEGDKNENSITKKFSDEGIVTSNYASTGEKHAIKYLF